MAQAKVRADLLESVDSQSQLKAAQLVQLPMGVRMAVLIRRLRRWTSLVLPMEAPGQPMVALPGRPAGLDLRHLVALLGRRGQPGPRLRKSPKLPRWPTWR